MSENAWETLLDRDFLLSAFPNWAQPDMADADLREKFLQFGLPILAPIREGQNFDVDYFVETNPRWEGVDAVNCYRAWLFDHVHEHPSAAAHLASLRLSGTTFPTAFHWRDYAYLKPAVAANRWSALEHFVKEGFRDFGEALTYGEGAQEFLIDLARLFSEKDDHLAIKAFNLALSFGPFSSPEVRQHLADAYLRLNFFSAAKSFYQELVDEGHANGWTVRNLYFSSIAVDQGDCALRALFKTAPVLKDDPIWRKTAEEVISAYFDAGLRKARAFYSRDEPAVALRLIADMVEQIDGLLALLPLRIEKTDGIGRRVILFVGHEDPILTHYRIDQKAALIESIGGSLAVIRSEPDDLEILLSDACAAVFLEMSATPQSLRWLNVARKFGVPTFYEAYSPGFDPDLAPPPLEAFAGFLTEALYAELRLNVASRHAFAGKCDFGIAPTESIAGRLEAVTQNHKCWVLPDDIMVPTESGRSETPSSEKGVTLFLDLPRFLYLTPNDQAIGSAIFECLSNHKDVRLAVAGYVRLDPQFDLFNDRIVEFGEIESPGGHLAKVLGPCINLAPTVDRGDDAVSVGLWREAAKRAIPSVIDAIGSAAAGTRQGVDALIAKTPSDWLNNITHLVADSELRSQIGDRAHRRVVQTRASKKDAELAKAIFFQEKGSSLRWLGAIRKSPPYLR